MMTSLCPSGLMFFAVLSVMCSLCAANTGYITEQKYGACPTRLSNKLTCGTKCWDRESDYQCPGSQKCCNSSCGYTCMEPDFYPCPTGAPFRNNDGTIFQCGLDGQTCPDSYSCRTNNHPDHYADCCPNVNATERVKAGKCPVLNPDIDWSCREKCNGDASCPAQRKCCHTSHYCGKMCWDPEK